VIRAEGRDTRGQGSASATITAELTPDGDGTKVSVITDLTVTGKVAQFGRGAMAEVSAKLMDQFVEALEADVLSGRTAPAAPTPPTGPTGLTGPVEPATAAPDLTANGSQSLPVTPAAPQSTAGPRRIESAPAEAVDLVSTAGPSVAKRVGPVLATVLLVLLVWRRRRRTRP
jgi:hypothetical protein